MWKWIFRILHFLWKKKIFLLDLSQNFFMTQKLTPMQRQYQELKNQNTDSILFFRLGDFYEMFGDDAQKASKILGITLTARNKGTENETPMCGVPFHAAENYINKLTKAGEKVAICEQVSDPSLPGIVERAIVRIITPGTVLSESVLDEKTSNYLVSVFEENEQFGLAFTDISTGAFSATKISSFELLKNELLRLSPAELLLDKNSLLADRLSKIVKNISFWFLPKNPQNTLTQFFQIPNLKVFYIENENEVVKAAALLLDYVIDTQKGNVSQITKITKYSLGDFMPVDYSTIKNLEVFQTMHEGSFQGSLLSVIDETVTAAGGRKLKNWLIKPLKDIQKINERLDAVEQFTKNHSKRNLLREALKETRDLERLLGKIASSRGNPKDLISVRETLKKIPEIQKLVKEFL